MFITSHEAHIALLITHLQLADRLKIDEIAILLLL